MIKCLYCGQDLDPREREIMDPETGFTKSCVVLTLRNHFENCPITARGYRTYKKLREFCRGNPALRKMIHTAMALGLHHAKKPPKRKSEVSVLLDRLVELLDELDRMELLPEVQDG